MTMSKIAREKLFVDESRIWNLEEPAASAASTMSTKIRSYLITYMWEEIHVEAMLRITKHLSSLSLLEKNLLLKTISGYYHYSPRQDNFYHHQKQQWGVLYTRLGVLTTQILL